jgi:Ca2+/Na+ antiporter
MGVVYLYSTSFFLYPDESLMKRYLVILGIVLLVVLVILFINKPEVLDKIWLWLIGFIGYILLLFQKGAEGLKELFSKKSDAVPPAAEPLPPTPPTVPPATAYRLEDKIREIEERMKSDLPKGKPLNQHFLTVLRYIDDGQTTLGLLFLQGKFFAYTLEDTHQDEKIRGNTRIPEGVYPLELNRNVTGLTQTYRNRFPWFDFHVEIKNIPDFSLVYIHIGNTNVDTMGCILIADGVNAADTQKMITHSRKAFERFYKTIHPLLNSGRKLSIQLLDEDWIQRTHLIPIETEAETNA